MKVLTKKPITKYKNYIEEWYENHTLIPTSKKDICKYEKGMMISISNNKCTYETLYPTFKEVYISIIKALKGKDHNISKWDVRTLKGCWEKKNGDRIVLPSREELLRVIVNQTPIMLAGIHNYKKDDIRSRGKEYCHTHFYIYNIHHHLPSNNIELRDMEDKIERHLQRYTKIPKRLQGIIRLTEVGIGEYKYTEKVSPTELYDYLKSPITNPHGNNLINYISKNRHSPSIQYPLTTIYLNKKL